MKKAEETKVACPKCGTRFVIAEKTHKESGVAVGKDSGLGTIYLKAEREEKTSSSLPSKATERIEALRAAGVDVSCFFAMSSANGGEFVGKNENGRISLLTDDDPIFDMIRNQGDVPNGKLFRRWVMSQMFHMLAYENHERSITEQIRAKGYDYMWKQMEDELHAQKNMWKNGDSINLTDRNRWFNKLMVCRMIQDYRHQLYLYINKLKIKKCKGIPYKCICGENIFVEDIYKKVLTPISRLMSQAEECNNPSDLYYIVARFNRKYRKRHGWTPKQYIEWVDAYKGAGAFFTMQNMIRFHGCTFKTEDNQRMDKDASYKWLELKAEEYREEGWRLLGLFRKFLADNNIDIKKKMAEWRKDK